tara:strand:+ start:1009 stop:1299 length:291 start_codon:yes stop_codon:yes gene_type:complete
MSPTKKSTIQQLSATGELISDGLCSAAKSHAAKAITDGKQPNINRAVELIVTAFSVDASNRGMSREVRDTYIAGISEMLMIAHKEEVQNQEKVKAA